MHTKKYKNKYKILCNSCLKKEHCWNSREQRTLLKQQNTCRKKIVMIVCFANILSILSPYRKCSTIACSIASMSGTTAIFRHPCPAQHGNQSPEVSHDNLFNALKFSLDFSPTSHHQRGMQLPPAMNSTSISYAKTIIIPSLPTTTPALPTTPD